MLFVPLPGVTLLIPFEGVYHLHFILTSPVRRKNLEEVLVVGITSAKVDPEFTLDRGDHPFITHKSYINYRQAQILSVAHIRRSLENGEYKLRKTADLEIVKYICQGLLESRHSLPQHRKFYKKSLQEKF